MELKLDIKSDFSKLIKKHFCQIYYYKIQHDLTPTRQNFIGPSIVLLVPSCQYRSVTIKIVLSFLGVKYVQKISYTTRGPMFVKK